ncbi:hypothetical protein CAOG_08964 [Capsaspora owczarzaki ATCC 30864]|uniref:Uncharacterized protein n=1 Tax=Capsaspora owczarzaki (strain ATCC 30864) TaxID=595528 RepID=A0A0D2WTJ2_CAPO3|nr:hypothetical protein CAOG_08964 [Capsaspora owczarzaki ATCC 30864]KJE95815.1 hypothetical protein CAOG_008964 [Capsaspora owczarzaki ATCC 30864]|eukprot:XP_011270642.1 hypothetical protein CAOG_08964 [Capsaspora owczarzaki ATCC 30864]
MERREGPNLVAASVWDLTFKVDCAVTAGLTSRNCTLSKWPLLVGWTSLLRSGAWILRADPAPPGLVEYYDCGL